MSEFRAPERYGLVGPSRGTAWEGPASDSEDFSPAVAPVNALLASFPVLSTCCMLGSALVWACGPRSDAAPARMASPLSSAGVGRGSLNT